MRFFVTGATGFVGSAVVQELVLHGHQVVGLSRSETNDLKLEAQGATAVRGTVEDLDVLKRAASKSDAVLHLAFNHDVADFDGAVKADYAAIAALGQALVEVGGDRALVISSGTMMLTPGVLGDEDSPKCLESPIAAARAPAEDLCLGFAKHGLRASVVRLAACTYGPGFSGFMGHYITFSIKNRAVCHIEGKEASWSAGHRDDAAVLYRLAGEKGGRGGTIYHAMGEEGVPLMEIGQAVAKELGLPTKSIALSEVDKYFSWFSFSAHWQNLSSSKKTQEALGWKPTRSGLIETMPIIVAAVKDQISTK